MLKKLRFSTTIILLLSAIFFVVAVHYNFNMSGYQQFVYLAKSFLLGKLNFIESYDTWWHDAVFFKGNYFWPLGPFPAVVLMPFVGLWQGGLETFRQGYVQIFLVLATFLAVFQSAKSFKYSADDALFWAFAFCFATNYIGVALWPNSWFFAQVVTVLLIFWALKEFLGKQRYWLIGILFALIYLSRVPASLGIIFFGLEILFKKGWKFWPIKVNKLLQLGVPFFLGLVLMFTYNYLRFGNFFEQGYGMQITAGAFSADMKQELFSPNHIPGNLYYMLFATPTPVLATNAHVLIPPFIKADPWGISIFITAPYLLLLFILKYKKFTALALLGTTIVISLPIILYYGIGWYQFGFRYALDFLPFLFVLLMLGYKETNNVLSLRLKSLFILTAVFNLYLFKGLFLL